MVDRYTKVVLTVIAVCLLWLCLWGPAPKWGTPAEAAGIMRAAEEARQNRLRELQAMTPSAPVKIEGTVESDPYGRPLRVDIVAVGGKRLEVPLISSFDGISAVQGLPVEVRGRVKVEPVY
jgi:hypothetical protein